MAVMMSVGAVAEQETGVPDYYGKDELAKERALMKENIERTKNPAIMAKSAEALLTGPLRASIRVVDDKTSKPVTQYVVHAFYVARGRRQLAQEHHDNVSGVKWAYRYDRELPIGRFESKVVTSGDGMCAYENLPAGGYWFQIIADGYSPRQISTAVMPDKMNFVFGVTAAKALTLRLVDGMTSKPLANIPVRLMFSEQNESRHTQLADKGYEAETDGDGFLSVAGLPNDRYSIDIHRVNVPELQHAGDWRFPINTLDALQGRLSQKIMNSGDLSQGVGEAAYRATEAVFARPLYYAPPIIADVNDGKLDMGTIALARTPILEIEIVDGDGGAPLAFFPFEIEIAGPNVFRYITDRQGRARVPLLGFTPGNKVALMVPAKMDGRYQIKELRVDASKPVHPNATFIHPQVGQIMPVRLTYKPTEYDIDLRLAFRDKATGKPVENVSGAIAEFTPDMENIVRGLFFGSTNWEGVRRFEAVGGKALVRHYTIDEMLANREKSIAKLEKENPGYSGLKYERDSQRLLLYVRAPGYAWQTFEIPLAQARSGKELAFDLEAGTTVRGRVMIAPGVPFTSGTLKTILVKQGQWNDQSEEVLKRAFGSWTEIGVRFDNQAVEGEIRLSGPAHFARYAVARIQPDGTFVTHELRADKNWSMAVATKFYPSYRRANVEIKPGDNDLGDIIVGRARGSLKFHLVDEKNKPVEGAALRFPLENIAYHSDPRRIVTDANGRIELDLSFMEAGSRQVLQLNAPWGYDEEARRGDESSHIVFDAIMKLDPSMETDMQTTVSRGNTLTVNFEPGAMGRKLVDYFDDPKNWSMEYDRRRAKPYFAACGYAIEQLISPEKDFRYHQSRSIAGGVSLTSGSQRIVIKNVPPGRMALRIDAGFYARGRTPQMPDDTGNAPPIAYKEFEMPGKDHAITVGLERNEVVVEIDATSSGTLEKRNGELLLFMAREEPTSTVFGSPMRRIAAGMPGIAGKSPEKIQTPMLEFMDVFVYDSGEGVYQYRPARFMAVAPGRYVLSAYRGMMALMGPAPKPVWQQDIEVKAGGGEVRVEMK